MRTEKDLDSMSQEEIDRLNEEEVWDDPLMINLKHYENYTRLANGQTEMIGLFSCFSGPYIEMTINGETVIKTFFEMTVSEVRDMLRQWTKGRVDVAKN
jgi:hypothetical protein